MRTMRKTTTMVVALTVGMLLLRLGCSAEDLQRDALMGGLAAMILMDQSDDQSAGQGIPGAEGPAGQTGPAGATGTAGSPGATGPQGTTGETGIQGAGGATGPSGGTGAEGASGPAGPIGPAGPEMFGLFIDDFFATDVTMNGHMRVDSVIISEPVLGLVDINRMPMPNAVAYRMCIPDSYDEGNDVTMRLFLHRTGPPQEDCFVLSLEAACLIPGEDVAPYGQRRWIRIDVPQKIFTQQKASDLLVSGDTPGIFVVVDLPVNSPQGLDMPDLLRREFVAFELATYSNDGGQYHVLGVEFFESEKGSATTVNATVFMSDDEITCNIADCNENGINDFVDIARGDSFDCNENGVPDECELDCNENGRHDDCDIEFGDSFDCNLDGIPDECTSCPPLDLVFIVDTSGSMRDEGVALCQHISATQAELAIRGIVFNATILGIAYDSDTNPLFACLTDNVVNLYGQFDIPGDNGSCPSDMPSSGGGHDENWGPATALVAEYFPWTTDAVRMIVPISDEGPCMGRACYDPGSDRDAIMNAIAMANDNDVFVSTITGSGSNDCVNDLAQDLALGTGGSVFNSTDASMDLADGIYNLVVDVCSTVSDCNDNGVPDECDIMNDSSEDCNGNGVPDECDGGCGE